MSSYTLQSLTEGIRQRHVGVQNKRLVEKWARTGLLRGLNDVNRENMSQLLENQASQLLRESNTLGNDAVKGFTSIAFPIVRRVFGGLVANELVSIQPMSLPSGLLFYLDYTYGSNVGGDGTDATATYKKGQSIYNNPTGKDIRTGSLATGGQYDLIGSGFSKLHKVVDSVTISAALSNNATGVITAAANVVIDNGGVVDADVKKLLQYDSQIIDLAEEGGEDWSIISVPLVGLANIDLSAFKDIAITNVSGLSTIAQAVQSGSVLNVRRLNQLGTLVGGVFTPNPFVETGTANAVVLCVVKCAGGAVTGGTTTCSVSYIINDTFNNSSAETLVIPGFESDLGVRDAVDLQNPAGLPNPVIPEIDIKIESIPVTTSTRKLRARWSPELAQDLNAYHSLDAEVELTQILSEQIALEIDREILNDLLTQAQGANFFWSRAPGKFVNKRSGVEVTRSADPIQPGPAFTGTVREWYETLIETIIDVANEIHRKTLRGSANYIIVSPDVATVLEASVLYRPAYSIDGDGQVATPFTMGAEKIGSLSNRFTVYKDPYFPRNKILVGYKGGSYLETGFVYAPYVPLIVTPTIFAPEDFTPRKGVMTRYGKKMVRADFYGTVTCLDMNII
jgi:hypothetical protein